MGCTAASIPVAVLTTCAGAASLLDPLPPGCSWGTGWGESGYVRMSKLAWVGGPAGLYWQGIYSASRPVIKNGERGAGWDGVHRWWRNRVALAALYSTDVWNGYCMALVGRRTTSCRHGEQLRPRDGRPVRCATAGAVASPIAGTKSSIHRWIARLEPGWIWRDAAGRIPSVCAASGSRYGGMAS